MSEQSFADLGVSRAVAHALDEQGFDAPFAIQTKVIGDVLAGSDVLAKSPTGSGKTLAFMVPLIDSIDAEDPRPSALVLAPTRELATQIVDSTYRIAHARALKISAVYGGVGLEKQSREARKSHIVVATPGRLEDLLQRGAFDLTNVKVLVLDEADRMLDMGFRPAVDRIVAQCPKDRQTLFFSATLDGEAGRVAREYTDEPVQHEHVPPPEKVGEIEHRFVRVDNESRMNELVGEIGDGQDLTLVFVRTKRGADRLVKRLGAQGVDAAAMHGNKSQRQREKALAAFEAGRIPTLVATDVAARGIHVDNLSKVINFDPPGQAEDYVHRTGRTGRAGETGVAVTLVAGDQVKDMRAITGALGLDEQFAPVGPPSASEPREDRASARKGGHHNHGRPKGRQKRRGKGGPKHQKGSTKGRGQSSGGGSRTVASARPRRGR
ncbi:MAG: DEAD/DEAH box helicase [Solirubrobacterales bacterium]